MRKIIALLLSTLLLGVAMGQQVIDGVLQGSPSSFMYLTPQTGSSSDSWSDSWVKPRTYSNGNFSGGADGAITIGNFSHRFITTEDSTVSPANDNCFRRIIGNTTYNMPVLPSAWNSDKYPETYIDSVIQMGGPTGTTNRGCMPRRCCILSYLIRIIPYCCCSPHLWLKMRCTRVTHPEIREWNSYC